MAPRSSARFEEMREEKMQMITAVALKLFAEKTYDNTSIRDIAKAAGISKGLLYNYYESKEELLIAILNNGLDQILESFDPNHDGVLEPDEMAYFISQSFEMLTTNVEFWKLFFQINLQKSVIVHVESKIEQLYSKINNILIPYFTRMGFENPVVESMIFGALMDGLSMDYILKPDLFPIDDIKNEIIKRYCTKQN